MEEQARCVQGVGVTEGIGVRGVLVGGRVAVGVTMFTGILRVWPAEIALGSVRLLVFTMSSTVLLNFEAIAASESPTCTRYVRSVPFGRLTGTGVAVGIGIPG